MVFDADLNIHTPKLLGFDTIPFEMHLSNPDVTKIIQKWLIGKNDITNLGAFRKTTPPTRKSNIFKITELNSSPLNRFGLHKNNISVFAVGTYQEDDIGASCYQNNLAILESLLNHTDDKEGYIIADMVAGVDSFAGTLHAQFDLTCLIVEPTMRSIEVYEKYKVLPMKREYLIALWSLEIKSELNPIRNLLKNTSSLKQYSDISVKTSIFDRLTKLVSLLT